MKTIRKRLTILEWIFAVSAIGAICFYAYGIVIPALCFGGLAVLIIAPLLRQAKLYRAARLILESQIFSAELGNSEAVISPCGLLDGDRVYPWGSENTRLRAVEITPKYLFLSFGSKEAPDRLLLPHGFSNQQTVSAVKQRLRYETGVEASIYGFAV